MVNKKPSGIYFVCKDHFQGGDADTAEPPLCKKHTRVGEPSRSQEIFTGMGEELDSLWVGWNLCRYIVTN